MYQSDTEFLFPMRVAPTLRDLRGNEWQNLVDRVLETPEASVERLAFSLVLIRLGNCLTCHADSYRAMRGCTVCAQQTIRRFREDDRELIHLYKQAVFEVQAYLKRL